MEELGAQESPDKAVPQTTRLVFLGNVLDTVKMTIEIEPERLKEIAKELECWKSKKYATRNELESIIGKLQFMANYARGARVFISQMLNALRQIPCIDKHRVTGDIKKTYIGGVCICQSSMAQLHYGMMTKVIMMRY